MLALHDQLRLGVGHAPHMGQRGQAPEHGITKPVSYTHLIMSLLAKKMGVEDAWSKTDEEWVRTFLDSDHPAFEGCDIEEAINEGILARKDGIYDRATYPLGDKVFATPTGRLEFYTEMLYEFGAQVPTYLRGETNPENQFADKYPLTFIQ